MVATNCECGIVISFPNDGSNSIDAKWITFEKDCFKTSDLLWKEGFICPDLSLETTPARPMTGKALLSSCAHEKTLKLSNLKLLKQPHDSTIFLPVRALQLWKSHTLWTILKSNQSQSSMLLILARRQACQAPFKDFTLTVSNNVIRVAASKQPNLVLSNSILAVWCPRC